MSTKNYIVLYHIFGMDTFHLTLPLWNIPCLSDNNLKKEIKDFATYIQILSFSIYISVKQQSIVKQTENMKLS